MSGTAVRIAVVTGLGLLLGLGVMVASANPYDYPYLADLVAKSGVQASAHEDESCFITTRGGRQMSICISGRQDARYVSVRMMFDDFPTEPSSAQLTEILRRNYRLYMGHYGINDEGHLLFEINAPVETVTPELLAQMVEWATYEAEQLRFG